MKQSDASDIQGRPSQAGSALIQSRAPKQSSLAAEQGTTGTAADGVQYARYGRSKYGEHHYYSELLEPVVRE